MSIRKLVNYLFFILGTSLIVSCFGKKLPPPPPPPPAGLYNMELQNYLKTLEQTVLAHDLKGMMELMDADYVKEQHDQNLEGRTQQFIDELFCGNKTDDGQYLCIPFSDITALSYTAIVDLDDGYKVFYEVRSANHKIALDWWITAKIRNGKVVFGIYGAMG